VRRSLVGATALALALVELGLAATPEDCSRADRAVAAGGWLAIVFVPAVFVGIGTALIPVRRTAGIVVTVLWAPWAALVSALSAPLDGVGVVAGVTVFMVLVALPGLLVLRSSPTRDAAWAASLLGYSLAMLSVPIGLYSLASLVFRCFTLF